MMKYKKYPSYKDSGIEWLGEIPSNWNNTKIKYKAPFQVGWTPSTKDNSNFIGNNKWLTIGDLKTKIINKSSNNISNNAIKNTSMNITPKGSLLYSFKLSVGTVAFAGENLYTNEAIASFLKNTQTNLIYLYYAIPIFILKNATENIYGAKILNQELIRNAILVIPKYKEQEQIANFLDKATNKIDSLIKKQNRLIELLKEKRQALISHTVTKGLNPNVEFKDSGVEWIGKIPKHWNRSKLGFETTVKARLGWKGLKAEEYVKKGYVFLATPNIKYNEIDFINVNFITKDRYKESPEIMLREGDLLVTKDGSTTGTTNIVRYLLRPATVNSSIAVIRPKKNYNSIYLYYYFISTFIQETIKLMKGGMGVPHLFQADLRWFDVLLPPLEEQQQIADYLDDKTSKIDKLIDKSKKSVELLKEKREALISSAVTGKIDVRDLEI